MVWPRVCETTIHPDDVAPGVPLHEPPHRNTPCCEDSKDPQGRPVAAPPRDGVTLGRRELLRSGIVGVSVLLAGCSANSGSTTTDASGGHERQVRLIAHRGCADQYPENTILAAKRSAPHVDMIEFDVQRCGSGELVVFHDDELNRLTDATGSVSTTDWDRLRELTILDSAESIPRFEEFLDAVPSDTAVNIELKHAGMADEVVSAADACDNEVLVSSFRPAALREVRDRSDAINLAFLIYENPEVGRSIAEEIDCVAVNPSVELALETDIVDSAHEQGFEVNVWTVEDAETARRLVDVGAEGLFVNRWDLLEDRSSQGTP